MSKTPSKRPTAPEHQEAQPLSKEEQDKHDREVKEREAAEDEETKRQESEVPAPITKPAQPAGADLPTAQEPKETPQPVDHRKDPEQPGSKMRTPEPGQI